MSKQLKPLAEQINICINDEPYWLLFENGVEPMNIVDEFCSMVTIELNEWCTHNHHLIFNDGDMKSTIKRMMYHDNSPGQSGMNEFEDIQAKRTSIENEMQRNNRAVPCKDMNTLTFFNVWQNIRSTDLLHEKLVSYVTTVIERVSFGDVIQQHLKFLADVIYKHNICAKIFQEYVDDASQHNTDLSHITEKIDECIEDAEYWRFLRKEFDPMDIINLALETFAMEYNKWCKDVVSKCIWVNHFKEQIKLWLFRFEYIQATSDIYKELEAEILKMDNEMLKLEKTPATREMNTHTFLDVWYMIRNTHAFHARLQQYVKANCNHTGDWNENQQYMVFMDKIYHDNILQQFFKRFCVEKNIHDDYDANSSSSSHDSSESNTYQEVDVYASFMNIVFSDTNMKNFNEYEWNFESMIGEIKRSSEAMQWCGNNGFNSVVEGDIMPFWQHLVESGTNHYKSKYDPRGLDCDVFAGRLSEPRVQHYTSQRNRTVSVFYSACCELNRQFIISSNSDYYGHFYETEERNISDRASTLQEADGFDRLNIETQTAVGAYGPNGHKYNKFSNTTNTVKWIPPVILFCEAYFEDNETKIAAKTWRAWLCGFIFSACYLDKIGRVYGDISPETQVNGEYEKQCHMREIFTSCVELVRKKIRSPSKKMWNRKGWLLMLLMDKSEDVFYDVQDSAQLDNNFESDTGGENFRSAEREYFEKLIQTLLNLWVDFDNDFDLPLHIAMTRIAMSKEQVGFFFSQTAMCMQKYNYSGFVTENTEALHTQIKITDITRQIHKLIDDVDMLRKEILTNAEFSVNHNMAVMGTAAMELSVQWKCLLREFFAALRDSVRKEHPRQLENRTANDDEVGSFSHIQVEDHNIVHGLRGVVPRSEGSSALENNSLHAQYTNPYFCD